MRTSCNYYGKTLDYLANLDDIIRLNEAGIDQLENFYRHNQREISAITRVDAAGRIIYTIPFNENLIGQDLSAQPHNREIIARHHPLVSDVFTAVQGYQTVAYAMPVFNGQDFDGCLSILVPFEILARRYLEEIRFGDSGQAWMISKNGINLFCQNPDHIGRPLAAGPEIDPDMLQLIRRMMAGERGTATYRFPATTGSHPKFVRKQAVFLPVYLPNNYWSMAVATPESQILAPLNEFRLRWMLIFAVFGIFLLFFARRLFRTQALVDEIKRRRQSEAKLARNEEFLLRVFNQAPTPMVVFDTNGRILIINQRCQQLSGYATSDFSNLSQWIPQAYPEAEAQSQALKTWEKLREAQDETAPGRVLETVIVCKDGSRRDLEINLQRLDNRFIAAIFDRTLAKQLESERSALSRQKLRAGKMEALGLLAGSVAHDLNNILSGLINIPEIILLSDPLDDKLRRRIETIKATGQRAGGSGSRPSDHGPRSGRHPHGFQSQPDRQGPA